MRNRKPISILKAKNDLRQWITRGKFFKMYSEKDCLLVEKEHDRIRFHIYTDYYKYNIIIHCDTNYMGASFTNRRTNPGEYWLRGNDMADGEFCEETWNQILSDIVSNELTDVVGPIRQI